MAKRTGKRKEAALPAAACDQELYDRLTQFAEDAGLSRSEVIREAVEFFLRSKSHKQRQKKPLSGSEETTQS